MEKIQKKINFIEQLILIICYIFNSFINFYTFLLKQLSSNFFKFIFESISGLTGTGFSIFKNIKYLRSNFNSYGDLHHNG